MRVSFIRRRLLSLALCAAAAFTIAPRPAHAEDLLAKYSATDRFRSGTPRAFTITPDGGEVLFLRSTDGRSRTLDLWAYDTRTKRERLLLTATQLLAGGQEKLSKEEWVRQQRLRSSARGIATFELSRDGRRLLVPLSGRLFVLDRASGAVRELSAGRTGAQDAHFSPDGAFVGLVRDGSMCVIELASGAERVLAAREGEHVTWGPPDFIAQEEMHRYEGWWWSPDSRAIAVQRTDESKVERMRIADPSDPVATPLEFAYPRPGRANADVRLAVVSVDGGAPRFVEWDRAKYPYLCTVRWQKGGPLAALVMDRVQQNEALLACDVATGATRTLLAEHDDVWINLAQTSPRFLEKGGFLWIAERDDSGPQLELRGADGALVRRLTPWGLRVQSIVAVDEKLGVAYVNATTDALENDVYVVPLGGHGEMQRVSAEPGTDELVVRPGARARVRTHKPVAGPIAYVVEDARGKAIGELKSNAEPLPFTPNVSWERVTQDSLATAIVRPRDFDPKKRYPVVDWAYAGPHSNRVVHRADGYVLEQYLADQGFIVVAVDGHGTPGRTRSFERSIRGDLIGPALADHQAAILALCQRHPEMDFERVGVTGWSFGGYFAVLALERAGGVYKAGVAGAPVVDWRDYDTFYGERYLGMPDADSLAWAVSSALTDAAKLARPLLVIHGTADDNVYFFHTLKLADALNKAGVNWDFLPLPGQAHSVIEAVQVQRVYSRMTDYFKQHLGAPGDSAPPRP
jgi:dipeptidyl-peptidase-4